MNVFVACGGQDDNIGDSVLRRSMIRNIRGGRPITVFVGGASEEFISALELSEGDAIVRDYHDWQRRIRSASKNGPVVFFSKPGETRTDLRSLRERFKFLPTLLAVRRGGGVCIQTALGARSQPSVLAPVFRQLTKPFDLVYWRDPDSHAAFGIGEVMPDWAFNERDLTQRSKNAVEERSELVLSLRGDRAEPSDRWVTGVRAAAADLQLHLRVVVQVRRDERAAAVLARRLDAEYMPWEAASGHTEQEAALRQAYRRAAVVLSDRLHVLIVGATEGAIPLCLPEHVETKVGRHFDAIEYRDVSIPAAALSVDAMSAAIKRALGRQDELRRQISSAERRLAKVCGEIEEKISSIGGKGA